jgi:multisubunit Na+/H+ antiporter MnhB subunit
MNKKITGLILGIIAIVLYLLTISAVKTALKISLPAPITDSYLIIGAIVLLLLGAYLFMKSNGVQHAAEVPIYEGRKIVGYRRA